MVQLFIEIQGTLINCRPPKQRNKLSISSKAQICRKHTISRAVLHICLSLNTSENPHLEQNYNDISWAPATLTYRQSFIEDWSCGLSYNKTS